MFDDYGLQGIFCLSFLEQLNLPELKVVLELGNAKLIENFLTLPLYVLCAVWKEIDRKFILWFLPPLTCISLETWTGTPRKERIKKD